MSWWCVCALLGLCACVSVFVCECVRAFDLTSTSYRCLVASSPKSSPTVLSVLNLRRALFDQEARS